MLLKLRDPLMFDDIEKKNGCAVYLFINGHLKRSSDFILLSSGILGTLSFQSRKMNCRVPFTGYQEITPLNTS